MRRSAIVLLALVLAHAALADQNPDIRVYLDFDPPNGVTRIDPAPNTVFDIYVITDCFGPGGGLQVLAIAFERTFGAYLVGEYTLIGDIGAGDVEDPVWGWLPSACGDCAYPDENGIVVVGYVRYYYLGPPGYIQIIRTQVAGGESADCNFRTDYWCIAGNAGVGMDAPPGESGCACGPTPVEPASWSTVKALYR